MQLPSCIIFLCTTLMWLQARVLSDSFTTFPTCTVHAYCSLCSSEPNLNFNLLSIANQHRRMQLRLYPWRSKFWCWCCSAVSSRVLQRRWVLPGRPIPTSSTGACCKWLIPIAMIQSSSLVANPLALVMMVMLASKIPIVAATTVQ
jgi:hypothetical protein